MYLAPQNIPRAVSVLTLGNKVILCIRAMGLKKGVLKRERFSKTFERESLNK